MLLEMKQNNRARKLKRNKQKSAVRRRHGLRRCSEERKTVRQRQEQRHPGRCSNTEVMKRALVLTRGKPERSCWRSESGR